MAHWIELRFPDDSQQAEGDESAPPADYDFDDINRFLYSRVSSLMKDHDGTSKPNDASQAPIASAATDIGASEEAVVVADAQNKGELSLSLPPSQVDAHIAQTCPASDGTTKCLVDNGNSGTHESHLPSYEELQIQLHTNAASAISAATATGQMPSSEQAALQSISRKIQATSKTTQSAVASLIDPVHGSETLDSIGVRPLSAVQLRSSPHSSSESLHSLTQTETKFSQSKTADSSVVQVDALANSLMTNLASPTMSSPKTYLDLQIALQHGYSGSASAPIELTNEDAKSSNPSETTESAQTSQRNRSAFSKTSVSRGNVKNSKSQSQVKSSKSNEFAESGQLISTNQNPDKGTAGRSSKDRISNGPVSTFNVPSSFFS